MDNFLRIFKALSDETRLRVVMALSKGERCVCELTELLNLSQPKVSRHLAKLNALGIVQRRRETQFIYYSLVPENHDILPIIEVVQRHQNNPLTSRRLARPKSTLNSMKGQT